MVSFLRSRSIMSKSPATSRTNAPPQLRRSVGFTSTRSALRSGIICSRRSSILEPARRRTLDASLHYLGRLRRLVLPDRLLKQRAAMTQALHHTLSASSCAFSLAVKTLYDVALQLGAAANSPARITLRPSLNTHSSWPAQARWSTCHSRNYSRFVFSIDVFDLDPALPRHALLFPPESVKPFFDQLFQPKRFVVHGSLDEHETAALRKPDRPKKTRESKAVHDIINKQRAAFGEQCVQESHSCGGLAIAFYCPSLCQQVVCHGSSVQRRCLVWRQSVCRTCLCCC